MIPGPPLTAKRAPKGTSEKPKKLGRNGKKVGVVKTVGETKTTIGRTMRTNAPAITTTSTVPEESQGICTGGRIAKARKKKAREKKRRTRPAEPTRMGKHHR